MSAVESVESLMQRQYDVTMSEADGEFWMEIPELNLLSGGASVEEAHANLNAAKRQLFESYVRSGKVAKLSPPQEEVEHAAFKRSMKPFIAKASIIALIGVILVVAANVSVYYVLQDSPRHIAQKASRAMLKNLVHFADKEMTPERQHKLRLALRGAVARLEPFRPELAALFQCPPAGQSTSGG